MPRKKPFSNKLKKKQLQGKRQKKREKEQDSGSFDKSSNGGNSADSEGEDESEHPEHETRKLHEQPLQQKGEKMFDQNRFHLHFARESKVEIEERKRQSREPFTFVPQEDLEVSVESVYRPGSVLDIPKRPPWNYSMSKEKVENNERQYFQTYLENIYSEHKHSELSYFEHNIETWRQLWRVLEVSDIVVLIVDIRHPDAYPISALDSDQALHFPPALYDYAVSDLKKKFILALNKIDLVGPEIVTAWRHYFKSKFSHIDVVCFTSYPKDETERKREPGKVLSKRQRTRKGNPVGPRDLLSACCRICGDKVDLSSWERRITEQEKGEEEGWFEYDEFESSDESEEENESDFEEVEANDAVLTLGLVGHPNVGKSSLLNGLVGKKVVSTSRTPGHTKHFQTIFLTPTVRLCDSPGLVFPSLVDKQLQILSGLFPISQVQEPYTAVGYLAARWPLVNMLQLVHPLVIDEEEQERSRQRAQPSEHAWSAWDVCDSWAEQRGYMTAKAGRRDSYRAANSILRLAVDGKVPMYYYPPGFIAERDKWLRHPDTKEIIKLQEAHSAETRRLKQMERELQDTKIGLQLPDWGRGRAYMESADGDDEEEADESGLATSNPFALLADE